MEKIRFLNGFVESLCSEVRKKNLDIKDKYIIKIKNKKEIDIFFIRLPERPVLFYVSSSTTAECPYILLSSLSITLTLVMTIGMCTFLARLSLLTSAKAMFALSGFQANLNGAIISRGLVQSEAHPLSLLPCLSFHT